MEQGYVRRAKSTEHNKNGIPRLRWDCCEGKAAYSEEEAEEQLRLVNKSDGKGQWRKYPCVACGHFHLGHIKHWQNQVVNL